MAESRRWLIQGRVQGVFFRVSTRRQAEKLGLEGYAINLPDGRVEVMAAGLEAQIDKLETWLHHGPTGARVDEVAQVEPADSDRFRPGSFRTG